MFARLIGAVAKRLPAHAKDRVEELLLGLRDFERLATPPRSALTIVCDDGELNDLDVVQVLDRHGVKGVFAVSPDLIGRSGFLNYEQLRRLRADGHEIAFHGTTHDPFTGFSDRTALLESVDRGLRQLEAEALGTPTTLIYPFGRHNRAVRRAMGERFQCGFTTWFGINANAANRYAIRRIPFGAYTGKLPATEAWYRGLLERCAAGRCWPTLMLHPAAPGHTAAHHALLSRLIEHARNLGMPVRTAASHIGTMMAADAASVRADTAQRT